MGLFPAKYDGTCEKCKAVIKQGEKMSLDDKKRPICAKCAPDKRDAKGSRPFAPSEPAFRAYAKAILEGLIPEYAKCRDGESEPLMVRNIAKKVSVLADMMVAEEAKRGIK